MAGMNDSCTLAHFDLGGRYYFSTSVALDAGLKFTVGKFSEGRTGSSGWVGMGDDSFSGTSSRLNVGISWHP